MPSLYEFTTPVGDVASGDFTTLYNASGLTVPNAGAGSVSGNLNVGGNLTVQGSSLLIGPVALQSTLSLPSYTFPSGDGTTYQVLATDGSGNLYWTNVQTLPGANYTISASTATGGANLDLVSGVTTDSVKFAGGTNVTVTRTDANTITISSTADDIPDGTANGQVLVWESGAWTANNLITATTSALLTAEFKSNSTTTAGSFAVRRNTGSTAYGSGTSASLVAQVDSDSQAVATFGSIGFGYDASDPTFGVRTSTNNFSTNTKILGADSTELVINGTNITLNDNLTGAPSSDVSITVNRGSSTDATLVWSEANDQWEFNNQLYITAGNLYVNGEVIGINKDDTTTDSYLYMKGTNKYLAWLNSANRFFFNEDAKIDGLLELQGDQLVINVDNTYTSSAIWAGTASSLTYTNATNDWTFSDSLNVQGNLDVTGNIDTGGITAGNITVGVVTDNEISTTTGDLLIVPATGSTVTIASSVATDPVIIARVTTNTNAPTRGATLRANSTGTPAVGLGVSLDFEVETAVSTFTSGGNIAVVATDITPASEDFKMEFSLTAAGAQSVVATLDNAGTLELDGNIQLDGNQIKSSTGATAIGLSNTDVAVVGDFSVHSSSTDASIIIGSTASLRTLQTTTASTSTVAIATTARNSMSGSVTITDTVTSALHTVNFTMLKNGATAMLTTYGELYTAAALAAFTADISGSNLRLLATPASSNSTRFNVVRTSLD